MSESLLTTLEIVDLEPQQKQSSFSKYRLVWFALLSFVMVFSVATGLVFVLTSSRNRLEGTVGTNSIGSSTSMSCGSVTGFWYRDVKGRKIAKVQSDTWMRDLKKYINNMPLSTIKTPATHDSGTYNITIDQDYSSDTKEDSLMAMIPYLASVSQSYGINVINAKKFVQPWFKTQECDIYQQLLHGIRHFDLRVCVVSSETIPANRYWLCHGLLSVKLVDVLRQVKSFVSEPSSKNEIVSLDINHIYGFASNSDHYNLFDLINNEIGNSTLVDPKQFNVTSTYGNVLSGTGRVFVYYISSAILNTYNTFRIYPGTWLSTQWANVVDMDKLKTSLYNQLQSRTNTNKGFVTQAVLTPTLGFMVDGLFNGVNSASYLATNYYGVFSGWINSYLPQSNINYFNTDYYNRHTSFVPSILLLNIPSGKVLTQFVKYDKFDFDN